jgi:hypothetical protein
MSVRVSKDKWKIFRLAVMKNNTTVTVLINRYIDRYISINKEKRVEEK